MEEIRGRNPIFQLENKMPPRDIVVPNLLKARYFQSGKNTPIEQSFKDDEENVFDVEDVLNNRRTKKKKRTQQESRDNEWNPYQQGKIELPKKKRHEPLRKDFNSMNMKERDEPSVKEGEEEVAQKIECDIPLKQEEYLMEKNFYEKMLEENLPTQDNTQIEEKLQQKQPSFAENNNPIKISEENRDSCPTPTNRLKKKDNPCLKDPEEIR